MCGIAGYSLSPESSVKRTLAAQALLAGIAERGADAVGYAHRGSSSSVTVHKRRSGASELLDEVHVPPAATQVLVHVRDYTKGHPDDRGEQPPDPPRLGGRDPQRDHRQRRGDLRPLRLRAGASRDDGRLRGDLRARRARAGQPRGARGAPRRDGDRLARRARLLHPLPRPRRRPAALGRARRQGALLRLDPRRARGARVDAAADAAQARGRGGNAAPDRGRPHRARRTASSPTAPTSRRRSSRRCAPRTRAPRA